MDPLIPAENGRENNESELSAPRQRRAVSEPQTVRYRVRIRFSKEGDLRLIGHRDLVRTLVRGLRRAEIPVKRSEGFHPRLRISFPLALGVGIVGLDEVMELELAEWMDPKELARRVSDEAPHGFQCLSVEAVDPRQRAQVRSISYSVPIPVEERSSLPARIKRFLRRSECTVRRQRRGSTTEIDLRALVMDLACHDDRLHMRLEVTPNGSARPEEVLAAVGLDHLLSDGAVLTRTQVELKD